MRIDGLWLLCDDGVLRPIFKAEIRSEDGIWIQVNFLADTGGDRTVLSSDVLRDSGLTPTASVAGLEGVGGRAESVVVSTEVRLTMSTGDPVSFRGTFAAVTQPSSLDMSVLGRDISNLFALIVDRPQEVVCLLGQTHGYEIVSRSQH
jgi:hypothetical protein